MTTDREPIRRSQLPPIPPPEWEFSTVIGARGDSGCTLLPGDTGPVVIRRRVTWGDWEPVHPDHWAAEPVADAANRNAEDPTARFQRAASMLVDAIVRAATASQGDFALVPSPDGDDLSNLARLRALLVADRDQAARNAQHARHEPVQLAGDGIVAGLDGAIRRLDEALGRGREAGDRSGCGPRACDPSVAGHSPANPSDGSA